MWQRHATIFTKEIGNNLTPTQWAALAKLTETGPCSQNQLGRLTAMDVATIKGVIDRLTARGLTETSPDPEDGRRLLVSLTRAGQQLAEKAVPNALAITKETLAPLDAEGARDAGRAARQAALTSTWWRSELNLLARACRPPGMHRYLIRRFRVDRRCRRHRGTFKRRVPRR